MLYRTRVLKNFFPTHPQKLQYRVHIKSNVRKISTLNFYFK
jgi:hypothetical protein